MDIDMRKNILKVENDEVLSDQMAIMLDTIIKGIAWCCNFGNYIFTIFKDIQ